jgi:hypothetical protein
LGLGRCFTPAQQTTAVQLSIGGKRGVCSTMRAQDSALQKYPSSTSEQPDFRNTSEPYTDRNESIASESAKRPSSRERLPCHVTCHATQTSAPTRSSTASELCSSLLLHSLARPLTQNTITAFSIACTNETRMFVLTAFHFCVSVMPVVCLLLIL